MSKLAQFLTQHPTCCFCGGVRPAESQDHVPPKGIFYKKQWPEGYVFPACDECNGGSRKNDLALAVLARLSFAHPYASNPEFKRYLDGLSNNVPEAVPEVVESSIQAKKILRELGVSKPDSMYALDFNIALVDPRCMENLNPLFRKIFCALFYLHCGKIFPKAAAIGAIRTTNQACMSESGLDWLKIPEINQVPVLRRNGKDLADQFDYRWARLKKPGEFIVSFHIGQSLFGLMGGPLPDSFRSKNNNWIFI